MIDRYAIKEIEEIFSLKNRYETFLKVELSVLKAYVKLGTIPESDYLKIKEKAKPKIPPVDAGVYVSICVGVIDLGEQYSEKFKNYSNKMQIVWELCGETEIGRAHV